MYQHELKQENSYRSTFNGEKLSSRLFLECKTICETLIWLPDVIINAF